MDFQKRFDERISFARYPGLRITEHTLIFFDGVCLQHLCEILFPNHVDPIVSDFSDNSRYIGRTLEQINVVEPNWQQDIWHAAMFYYLREPDARLWLAGRYEFLRDWSADHDMNPAIFKALYEASK
jgi:hypothetical protein